MDAISSAIAACEWSGSHYLVFSGNVFDDLIYYSHFTALFIPLLFGIFVYIKNRKALVTDTLLCLVFFLALWVFGDLVLWATEYSSVTMFFWSVINLAEPFVYAFSFYFIYVFIAKKDIPLMGKIGLFLPLLPIILLTPTNYALLGFDLSNCDRDAIEGPLVYYGYITELLYILSILVLSVRMYLKTTGNDRKQVIFVTTGIVLFLLSFAFGNIIGSLFSDSSILGDYGWTVGQYGLFGVPIFIGLLSYMIVRFKAFNIGLIAAQMLLAGLVVVLSSEFAFVTTTTNRILVAVTLILTGTLGIMLLRSVRREIEQRKHIELLAKDLEQANKQQVILIHFVTHQIKGFIAKSRNIFSLILEGDLGPVPDTMRPMVEEGFRSDTKGATTIQEILNAANIKNGKVAYAKAPFDISALVGEIVKDLKPTADAKNLNLTLHEKESSIQYTGDSMQLLNAFKNLIDNSIKYTPSGTVDVSLEKEGSDQSGKIVFKVQDTGVGIDSDDMARLFTEGGHGKESQKINVDSTGFGLYIVKNIIEAHGGKVWAESDGPGKGSRFIAEFPLGPSTTTQA